MTNMTALTTNVAIETISLVIPCFNEEKAVPQFLNEISSVLAKISEVNWEIIFVDDGSSDKTVFMLSIAAKIDSRIRIISLSRNFGKETAITAGIHAATGEAVIPMDVDLQDPPLLLIEMIEKYKAGWPIVQAVRQSRGTDNWLKRTTANLFYSFARKVAPFEVCPNAGDFQLLSRKVIEEIKRYPERNRFMKGVTASVGFPRAKIYFDREPRANGVTKFSFWKLWNFALDGITSFSTLPLRIWSYIGMLTSMVAFAWGTWLIFRTLYFGVVTPGYASVYVSVLFIGGIQLLGIGIIGEYIGRILTESKQRPLYHIAFDSKNNEI